MSDIAIKVENLSKLYQLGSIGTGTLGNDLKRWWASTRGKEDPFAKVGQVNDRTKKAESEFVWALKDIDFEVKKGDVVGIIGRNGAGKSTLLKILSKITSASTGRIMVDGRIASLLEVGTGFHPELTGRENIFMNGAVLGMRKWEIQKKLDEIIDFSGVEAYIDTPVKRYSSGMYVRLAFAVAAHLEPEILIVDEVLAVGDAEFQKKCLGKMKSVSISEGRTILFVSHNLAAVSNLCTRSLFMRNGLLQSDGATDSIIKEYISFGRQSQAEILKDDIFCLKTSALAYFNAIRIKAGNEVTDSINISDEIEVEVEFTVTKDEVEVFPSFHLLDNMDTCILASFNGPSATNKLDPFFGRKLQRGEYRSTMVIPANMLNDKVYRINAFLVPYNDTNNMAEAYDVLEFKVIDNGEMRKEYTGEWIGLIRPKLNWQTQKLV